MRQKIILKTRDTVHETSRNVRLNVSPVFKEKMFFYAGKALRAVRISSNALELKRQDYFLFIRDEGVVVIEGKMNKKELEGFQYRLRVEVAEIVLRELASAFGCVFTKRSENVFEISINGNKPLKDFAVCGR